MVEQGNSGLTTGEPLAGSETDNKWAKDILELLVAEFNADVGERLSGLLTDDCLVLLRQGLQKRQENGLVLA